MSNSNPDAFIAFSTVEEIRTRFDNDVQRFSNLETGQAVTIDSPLHLDMLTDAAQRTTPNAKSALDIGCGAGNYTLKLLERLPNMDVTLLDLSRPMLDAATRRVSSATSGKVATIQSDIREADLGKDKFDVVMAAQCLHHLRSEDEWRTVFKKIYSAVKPGGSFWIADSLTCESKEITDLMWQRHGEYLVELGGKALRDKVFAYVQKEDTPQTLVFQLDMLREVGFKEVDVLHMHNRFASFGGRKV